MKAHVKQEVQRILQFSKYMQGMLPPKTILGFCNLTESNSAHFLAGTDTHQTKADLEVPWTHSVINWRKT